MKMNDARRQDGDGPFGSHRRCPPRDWYEREIRRLLERYRHGDGKAALFLMDVVGDMVACTAYPYLRHLQGCATAVEEVVIDGQDLFWTKFVAPPGEPVEPIRSYVAWVTVCA